MSLNHCWKNENTILGRLSPAQNLFKFCWLFSWVSLLGLPFTVSQHLITWFTWSFIYSHIYEVCVAGLYIPVKARYNTRGSWSAYVLDWIGGLGLMTFIGIFISGQRNSVFGRNDSETWLRRNSLWGFSTFHLRDSFSSREDWSLSVKFSFVPSSVGAEDFAIFIAISAFL